MGCDERFVETAAIYGRRRCRGEPATWSPGEGIGAPDAGLRLDGEHCGQYPRLGREGDCFGAHVQDLWGVARFDKGGNGVVEPEGLELRTLLDV